MTQNELGDSDCDKHDKMQLLNNSDQEVQNHIFGKLKFSFVMML